MKNEEFILFLRTIINNVIPSLQKSGKTCNFARQKEKKENRKYEY